MSALTGLTYLAGDVRWAERLDITHNPASSELTIFCGQWRSEPLVFCGITLRLPIFLWAMLGAWPSAGSCTIGNLTKQEFLLPFIGGIFYSRSGFGDATGFGFQVDQTECQPGRRVFKMTPLHHHFEMSGWKEPKIVFRFVIVAVLFALLSLSTLKLR